MIGINLSKKTDKAFFFFPLVFSSFQITKRRLMVNAKAFYFFLLVFNLKKSKTSPYVEREGVFF